MAQATQRSDESVDNTPYGAFSYVVMSSVGLTIILSFLLWQGGSWLKSHTLHWNGISGVNFSTSGDTAKEALDAAQQAANNATKSAADQAAAAATQELLNQKDAAIQAGKDAVVKQVQQAVVGTPTPTPKAADQNNFQDYLK